MSPSSKDTCLKALFHSSDVDDDKDVGICDVVLIIRIIVSLEVSFTGTESLPWLKAATLFP
jgi:hypothetical protein